MDASTWRMARFFLVLLCVTACSGGGSGGGGGSGSGGQASERLSVTVPVDSSAPVSLAAGVPASSATHFEVPAGFQLGTMTGATFDLNTTIARMTISRNDGGASASPTVAFSFKVSPGNGTANACSTGVEAAGATVTGDATFATKSVSPGAATLSQAAVDIINTGDFTLCTTATSSAGVNLALDGVAASLGFDAACDAPNNVAGHWVGTYSCDNLCGGTPSTEGGAVDITLRQAGRTAVYWDGGGAAYVGSVCGSSFRHLGRGGGYVEFGTFTRTGASTAVKTSTWISTTVPDCGGTCSDALTLSQP